MKNFKFKIHDNNYNVHIISHEGNMINLEVNGTKYEVKMKDEVKKTKTPTLVRSALKPAAQPAKMNVKAPKETGTIKVVCPIPGVILSLNIKVGDTLNVGDKMLVLEAMKMENNITAEKAGTVTAIHIAAGDQVLQGALMIELE